MSTIFNDANGDHLWSNSGNWSDGIPDASDDVTVDPAVTSLIIDTAAICDTFNASGTSGIAISGAGSIEIFGDITLATNVTWTFTGDTTVRASGVNQYYGAREFFGTFTIKPTATAVFIKDASVFNNLTLDFSLLSDAASVGFRVPLTVVNGDFNVISYQTEMGEGNSRPFINATKYEYGMPISISVGGSINITGAVDFRDVIGIGSASWDFSSLPVGNCGGNTGITFRPSQSFYLVLGTSSGQNYGNYFATSSGGAPNVANIALPQDTIIVDNNTWSTTGQYFLFHAFTRNGAVDASGLTTAGNSINFPRICYGSIDYTGAGVSINAVGPGFETIDPRLQKEAGTELTLNIPHTIPGSSYSIGTNYGVMGAEDRGTVKLLSDIVGMGNMTLFSGSLDFNGHTLSCNSFISTSTKGREILDSSGNGALVLLDNSGTAFDVNASGLVISDTPIIQIGDGAQTLAGDVVFEGAGFTYGDLIIEKHAGDFDVIIDGDNTFRTITKRIKDTSFPFTNVVESGNNTLKATDAGFGEWAVFDMSMPNYAEAVPVPSDLVVAVN